MCFGILLPKSPVLYYRLFHVIVCDLNARVTYKIISHTRTISFDMMGWNIAKLQFGNSSIVNVIWTPRRKLFLCISGIQSSDIHLQTTVLQWLSCRYLKYSNTVLCNTICKEHITLHTTWIAYYTFSTISLNRIIVQPAQNDTHFQQVQRFVVQPLASAGMRYFHNFLKFHMKGLLFKKNSLYFFIFEKYKI